MPVNPRWKPKNLHKHFLQLIQNPENQQYSLVQPQQQIEAYLQPSSSDLIPSTSLSLLSGWHSINFIVKILARDQEGIVDIYRSLRYDLWELLGIARLYEMDQRKNKGSRLSLNRSSLVLAKAITLGCFQEAEHIGQILLTGIHTGLFYGLTGSGSNLAPFVLNLFCQWKSFPLPIEGISGLLDFYQKILMSWKSEGLVELETGLQDACDFHTFRSQTHTQKEFFEFCDPEYRIYPVEILMVSRLRQTLGLSLPQMNHPLMNSPLGRLYDVIDFPEDPLLERLITKFKKDLGIVVNF